MCRLELERRPTPVPRLGRCSTPSHGAGSHWRAATVCKIFWRGFRRSRCPRPLWPRRARKPLQLSAAFPISHRPIPSGRWLFAFCARLPPRSCRQGPTRTANRCDAPAPRRIPFQGETVLDPCPTPLSPRRLYKGYATRDWFRNSFQVSPPSLTCCLLVFQRATWASRSTLDAMSFMRHCETVPDPCPTLLATRNGRQFRYCSVSCGLSVVLFCFLG
mgnify:CR=1 FL=1